MSREKSPVREAGIPMNIWQAITALMMLATLWFFLSVGFERELGRMDADEQWFFCNFKKEC